MKNNQLKKYYDLEIVSIKGFLAFCKNNFLLLFTVTVALFFTYGIKLFGYSIGIDAELFITSRPEMWEWATKTGRFGFPLLSKLWHYNEFNPYTTFFVAFCLIWLFTISWCYIIAIFSNKTGRNYTLIPFALLFMTMPVWAEQFYFLQQVIETTILLSLCPFVIYLLYKGFLDSEYAKIACAFFLLVFMISVYQVILPFFCCGVFICFLLLQENSNYESRIYGKLCLSLFITLIGALICYFFIDNLIIPGVFNITKADYLDNMNLWGQRTLKEVVFHTLLFAYVTTIGHITFIQGILNPIFFTIADNPVSILTIGSLANTSRIWGNVFLLPVIVVFIVKIFHGLDKNIPSRRRALYIVSAIGIPVSIMFLTLAGGGSIPPLRSLFALPLAFSFMFFYIINSFYKKIAFFLTCLAFFAAFTQAKTTAQLFYSDQMRYNEDVRFVYELEKSINQVQPLFTKLPVAFVGKHQVSSRIRNNFLQGEVIGHSFFEWDTSISEVTRRGLAFMATQGIHFEMVNPNQLDYAIWESEYMPFYPNPGYILNANDYIIVKLSGNQQIFNYPVYDLLLDLSLENDIDILRQNVYDIIFIDFIDDSIVLQSGETDPQLFLPIVESIKKPSGKPFVEISYSNSITGYLQLYFNFGYGFSEEFSTGKILMYPNQTVYTIQLPIKWWFEGMRLIGIRLDPPNASSFTLKSIRFLSVEDAY